MTAHHWRIERADKMAVIIDAEEYFRVVRAAMLQAKRRILLIGWDFDARIALAFDFHPTSEYVGNPFLYAVERLRLHQVQLFLDDFENDDPEIDTELLANAIRSVLDYRVDGVDATIIPRQRMAGLYGPPGQIPVLAPPRD